MAVHRGKCRAVPKAKERVMAETWILCRDEDTSQLYYFNSEAAAMAAKDMVETLGWCSDLRVVKAAPGIVDAVAAAVRAMMGEEMT